MTKRHINGGEFRPSDSATISVSRVTAKSLAELAEPADAVMRAHIARGDEPLGLEQHEAKLLDSLLKGASLWTVRYKRNWPPTSSVVAAVIQTTPSQTFIWGEHRAPNCQIDAVDVAPTLNDKGEIAAAGVFVATHDFKRRRRVNVYAAPRPKQPGNPSLPPLEDPFKSILGEAAEFVPPASEGALTVHGLEVALMQKYDWLNPDLLHP